MDSYLNISKTISIYPNEIYKENLTPDCDIEIDDICNEIHGACKGGGNDSKRLIAVLGNTIGEERKKIALRYPELYSKDLRQLFKHECGNR